MELLRANQVEVERDGEVLVTGLDLTLRRGERLGLVGRNGSGKSTLLEVLAGRRKARSGNVRRPPGSSQGYLVQAVATLPGSVWQVASGGLTGLRDLERQIRAAERALARGSDLAVYGRLVEEFEARGGYRAEALLAESLTTLGVGEERLREPFDGLSEGERRRVQLVAALAGEPELLLLDEPTNHLDLPAVAWLEHRLSSWRGAIVLVSHDRALLDGVATGILELADGRACLYRGGYSNYLSQKGVFGRESERRERERRKETMRLERTAAELRSWGNAGAQSRRRRMERRIRELEEGTGVPTGGHSGPSLQEVSAAARGSGTRRARGTLLEVRDLVLRAGDLELRVDELRIEQGERLALLGRNGSGKTTLLAALSGTKEPASGEISWGTDAKLFYSDQRWRGLDPDVAVLPQLKRVVSDERAVMLLTLVGLSREAWIRLPGELSGGERARAGLARALADNGNMLLLDEPGNDLDLAAIETLHGALAASGAAILMVTHDRSLAGIAQRVLALEGGELIEYRGGIDGYLAGHRRREPGIGGLRQGSDPGSDPPSSGREPGVAPAAASTRDSPAESGYASASGGAPATAGAAAVVGDEARDRETQLERLELDLLGIEARLLDPLRLPERESARLRALQAATIDALSVLHDEALPPPAPRFTTVECSLRLSADLSPAGLDFTSELPATLKAVSQGDVAHLVLSESDGSCLTPWARGALIDGGVRLVFLALAPRVVQLFLEGPRPGRLMEDAGGGWWSLSREGFERRDGWLQPAKKGGPRGARSRRRRRGRGR